MQLVFTVFIAAKLYNQIPNFMKDANILLANKLQKLRKDRDLKQEVVARELKITQQAYSKLERGCVDFSSKFVNKICMYFEITACDFLNTGSSKDSSLDKKVFEDLLKSKEENIASLKKQIELLESMLKEKRENHTYDKYNNIIWKASKEQ